MRIALLPMPRIQRELYRIASGRSICPTRDICDPAAVGGRSSRSMLSLIAGVMLVLSPAPQAQELEPILLAEGVYAFVADRGPIPSANRGGGGNSGFIVGSSGVIVIDTGVSYRHGRAMIEAIRRVTWKPIELVIITHAVEEFLFGSAAFAELGAPLLTHARSAELMRSRCERCLENLRNSLGDDALAGTRLVIPGQTIEASVALNIGSRTLDLLYFGWASTPGDLAVLDQRSGVLFAGGLISVGRIPELRDGDFRGWLQALDQLALLPAQIIVPGHGAPSGAEAIAAMASYLRDLDTQVQALYSSGASLMEAMDRAESPNYAGWALYPGLHRENVLHRYLQVELEELGK
jgi:glyoxylase-like metal-dependent hydrolase (beta-lactamase superfamily II)